MVIELWGGGRDGERIEVGHLNPSDVSAATLTREHPDQEPARATYRQWRIRRDGEAVLYVREDIFAKVA